MIKFIFLLTLLLFFISGKVEAVSRIFLTDINTYDAEGIRKTITDSTGPTRYTVDPATSSHLIQHNPDGTKNYYVYGAGLLYEVNQSNQNKFHHYDQVGSTVMRTNDAGIVIGKAQYSSYGKLTYREGDMNTPFLYNGKYGVITDRNGLLHMRARYYSPYYMRFLNPDPIGFSGGPNFFAYADGNPISKADPFGLAAAQDDLWGQIKDAFNSLADSMLSARNDPNGAMAAGVDHMIEGAFNSSVNPVGEVRLLRDAGAYAPGSDAEHGGPFMAAYMQTVGFALAANDAFGASPPRAITTYGGQPEFTTVTSWAEAGITPDLNVGRWVQIGEATQTNFWKTGLPGPKGQFTKDFPFLQIEGSKVPFENSITRKVPLSSVSWPSGLDKWRGAFGQRQITGGGK